MEIKELTYPFAEPIGPRQIGGTYFCGYWAEAYTVVGLVTLVRFRQGKCEPYNWAIRVQWEDGHCTTHSTAWDPARDKVIA